ncbi:MAG: putative transporter, partial [Mycobacterium sp.]|nr:putative transporter [Mycobacterium sp.]
SYLFLGTVVGFLLSAALVIRTALPQHVSQTPADSLWQRATSGARVMARHPVLRSLLALNLAVASATALVVVNTVVYVHGVLDGGSPAVAALLACYGGGSMVVALLVPRLLTRMSDRRLMLTGAGILATGLIVITALLLVEPGPTTGWLTFPVVWATLGVGASLINTPSARLLRYETEPGARSAVFAAQFSLSHACFFLTYPLAGWLGALAGQPVAAGALAALAVGAAATAARLWPTSRASVRDAESLTQDASTSVA